MIAYFEKHNTTVDVPDDISQEDLKDINDHFESYVQPEEQSPQPIQITQPSDNNAQPSQPVPASTGYTPNFYESVIKPNLHAIIPTLSLSGLPLTTPEEQVSPETEAFTGKALQEFSFGGLKPVLDPLLNQTYKDHPAFADAGQFAGGIGSLAVTGGLLEYAKLGQVASQAGKAAVEAGMTAGERFIPKAIMTGATFGTRTFIADTLKAFQDGKADIAQFGTDVLKDTAFGATFGAISGIKGAPTAIASAAGLGFISKKASGGDYHESLLNAAIWGTFEAIGSFGRTPRLITESLNNLSDSVGEYFQARNPEDTFGEEGAKAVGKAVVENEIRKQGFDGIEDIAKSGPENTLRAIEAINEKVRQGIVPRGITEPTEEAPKITGPTATEPVNVTPKPEEPFHLKPDVAALERGEKIEAKPGQMPSEQTNPPTSLPTAETSTGEAGFRESHPSIVANLASPTKSQYDAEQTPGVVFPQTEISSDPSIANHPDFIQLTKDAEAVTKKYAEKLGIVPTAHLAESLFRAIHADMGDTRRAMLAAKSPEEAANIKQEFDARWPDADREFATLHSKLYSDITTGWFKRNEIGYGAIRPQAAIDAENAGPEEIARQKHLADLENYYAQKEAPITEPPSGQTSFAENYPSSKNPTRQYGNPEDEKASLTKKLGGLEYIQKMKGPELIKLAKAISGHVPIVKKMMRALGYFYPGSEKIALHADLFKDQKLWESVLAHEIGHLMDYNPDKTMARGNILGRIASLKDYRKSLLPEFQGATEKIRRNEVNNGDVIHIKIKDKFGNTSIDENGTVVKIVRNKEGMNTAGTKYAGIKAGEQVDFHIQTKEGIQIVHTNAGQHIENLISIDRNTMLTNKDRQRFRAEAQKMVKGQVEQGPDRQFEPQAILDVWNSITSDIDPELHDYIKGLDVDQKKSLIKGAMSALKNGEKITVYDINKFNKEAGSNLKQVSDIYSDLLKKEIKKRKLWENEVIKEELKKLSQYWKPFNVVSNPSYTAYRYSGPEIYADFVSVLLNAPAKAKEIAPNSYQAFFNYLQNKPEVMSNLLELQALTQSDDMDLQKVRGEDILQMFEKGEQAFRARQANIEAANKTTWDKMRVLFWDKNSVLLDARDKLAKEQSIPADQDMKYAIEKNSMMASFLKSYLDILDSEIVKPAREENLLNEVKTVLFLDRVGGDRSEMANPLGHTPETAKAFLDNMEKTDPQKFARVNQLAIGARHWFKQVSTIPGADDFYSPAQKLTIEQNDKYAPFRVVDYMKDYMSSGMAGQVGTFKDVGDPLTSMAMKGQAILQAIERNRLKKIIGHGLIQAGVQMRPAKVTNIPGKFHIEEPSENYLGTLAWKENGEWKAYHTDKYISDLFTNTPANEISKVATALNTVLGNRFFRPLYTIFNLNFTTALVSRDFLRTWRLNPELGFGTILKNYLTSVPSAIRRVKGAPDPLIQQMERAGALQHLNYNDLFGSPDNDEQELDHLLSKYITNEEPNAEYKGIPIIKQLKQIRDFIHFTTDVLLTLPKVAGWKALEDMPEEQRSYTVRNMVGHPNFKRTGKAAPITNALFLFSNMFKEGLRDSYEIANDPRTRATYWTRTAVGSILPKILMAMAAAGAFGEGYKKVMDKISEYKKSNYIVIPLGVDGSGNGVALTLPQDEDGRIWGALMWKLLNHEGNLTKNLSDVLAFGEGFIPGFSPAFSLAKAWTDYLSGGKPRDNFKGQDILTDKEREAGGKYAFEPMVRWTINQSGMVRMDIRDRLKDEPVYKTILAATPILQRLLTIEKIGEYEQAKLAEQPVIQEKARESLDRNQEAMDAIRKGTSEEDFINQTDDEDEQKKLKTAYRNQSRSQINDPMISAIARATSTDAKVSLLEKAKENYPDLNDYNDFIDNLNEQGIISDKVALKARE